MVWIYAMEGSSPSAQAAQAFLREVRKSPHTLLVSHFLLAEVLVVPVRQNNAFVIAAYRRMLFASGATEVVSFDGDAAMQFAALRAQQRVKPADAVHLALAARAGADAFITMDGGLQRLSIPNLRVISDLNTPLI